MAADWDFKRKNLGPFKCFQMQSIQKNSELEKEDKSFSVCFTVISLDVFGSDPFCLDS